MNFFKSVFADDPDPTSPKSEPESDSPKASQRQQENPDSGSSSNIDTDADTAATGEGAWSFGGLIKTLTSRSESVIETYRRDLKEFGSGLRKEFEVAQGSLGNVSIVIDEFGNSVLKGTAEILSHGKEAILATDHESDSSDSNYNISNNQNNTGQQKRYSRFDAQVRVIQGDVNTYCEEIDDLDDYNKWKSGFALDDMTEEIERLIEENGAMENVYKRVVPDTVDHETFWFRYFYRLFKLKQTENLRATLVKRAISREEEDLSWDVDDDDENENQKNVVENTNLKENEDVGSKNSEKVVGEEANVAAKSDLTNNKELDDKASEKIKGESLRGDEEGGKVSKSNLDEDSKRSAAELNSDNVDKEKVGMEKSEGINKENSGSKADEKVTLMGKAEPGESSKDSDFSVVSSQPSLPEEEDLGWDEIEDLSSIDEKKVAHAGSPNRADLRKRLNVAEDDEDLSWDIEDEDEPVKA